MQITSGTAGRTDVSCWQGRQLDSRVDSERDNENDDEEIPAPAMPSKRARMATRRLRTFHSFSFPFQLSSRLQQAPFTPLYIRPPEPSNGAMNRPWSGNEILLIVSVRSRQFLT